MTDLNSISPDNRVVALNRAEEILDAWWDSDIAEWQDDLGLSDADVKEVLSLYDNLEVRLRW